MQGDIDEPSNTFEGPCVGILIDRGEFTDSHHKTVYMCLNGIKRRCRVSNT